MSNFEVLSDGRTVWVNDSTGCCVGRFSRSGIDIHHTGEDQMSSGKQCLDCKTGPCSDADWEYFRIGMRMAYDIEVLNHHMPTNLS